MARKRNLDQSLGHPFTHSQTEELGHPFRHGHCPACDAHYKEMAKRYHRRYRRVRD